MQLPNEVLIYTDGACEPNPGVGGWGAVIRSNNVIVNHFGGPFLETTNNQMEMMAVAEGLERLHAEQGSCIVRVFTDSRYVEQGITAWVKNWERNCWITKDRKPVKNVELWKRIQAAKALHVAVAFQWVKGHAGDPLNELADWLASIGRENSLVEKESSQE